MNWLNENGLVKGKIPAGTICHYSDKCNSINEYCPTKDNIRDVDFSCARARFMSLEKSNKILK